MGERAKAKKQNQRNRKVIKNSHTLLKVHFMKLLYVIRINLLV